MEDFLKYKDNQIKILKNKSRLTDAEQKRLNEFESIDNAKANEAYIKSRENIDGRLNKEYYSSSKFLTNVGTTSLLEGAKMGKAQLLGALTVEFFTALIGEIKDILKNGWSVDSKDFIETLKLRASKIKDKILNQKNDILKQGFDGFISGIISNIVTIVINSFVTTAKNIVRIIREGFFSLIKALKIIIFRPNNMTQNEALHEASKLLASGL